ESSSADSRPGIVRPPSSVVPRGSRVPPSPAGETSEAGLGPGPVGHLLLDPSDVASGRRCPPAAGEPGTDAAPDVAGGVGLAVRLRVELGIPAVLVGARDPAVVVGVEGG